MVDTIFELKHTGFAIEFLIDVPPERHKLLLQLTEWQFHIVHISILITCQKSVSASSLSACTFKHPFSMFWPTTSPAQQASRPLHNSCNDSSVAEILEEWFELVVCKVNSASLVPAFRNMSTISWTSTYNLLLFQVGRTTVFAHFEPPVEDDQDYRQYGILDQQGNSWLCCVMLACGSKSHL